MQRCFQSWLKIFYCFRLRNYINLLNVMKRTCGTLVSFRQWFVCGLYGASLWANLISLIDSYVLNWKTRPWSGYPTPSRAPVASFGKKNLTPSFLDFRDWSTNLLFGVSARENEFKIKIIKTQNMRHENKSNVNSILFVYNDQTDIVITPCK